jgi:hypothetical protein
MQSPGIWIVRVVLIALNWMLPIAALADQQDQDLLNACPTLREWKARRDQLAEKHETLSPSPVILPRLQAQLLEWGKLDQKVREPLMQGPITADNARSKSLFVRMRAVDELNYRRIKNVIDEYGFPTISMVGGDGSAQAFLIVQHQASHPEFQQFVLDIMGPLAKRGEVGREGYALLLDRVLVMGKHQQQRYGTQFKQVDGRMLMEPVEDPKHLDERRAEMGMMPIAAYRCVLEHVYHVPVQ